MAPPQPPSGLLSRPSQPYRDGPWVTGFEHPPPHMVAGSSAPPYGYRYRDEQTDWATAPPNDFPYDPATVSLPAECPAPCIDLLVQYEQTYEQAPPFIHNPGPSTAGSSNVPVDNAAGEKSRGRKRSRNQANLQMYSRSHISEILVGNSCSTALYPCPQSKESACPVSHSTKPRNQEHVWRESFHFRRCVVSQAIHRLLSRARSRAEVCVLSLAANQVSKQSLSV